MNRPVHNRAVAALEEGASDTLDHSHFDTIVSEIKEKARAEPRERNGKPGTPNNVIQNAVSLLKSTGVREGD